ncbi:protein TRACHEARY ELEMENT DIFFERENTIATION-RELATED 7A-like [Salvia miltiorrhiza]|uniref:protein TRACHEARY ELEMENT DIFFERENTIATION-RELATED 7A-like n=1 Tax=Salvia miltiorrhiza TaxID=226208 RepID=UPI0025AC3258|nr:protein TRACHEARY ELEMENT DIFFERENTIATION-RELATED 7A-like [Salvia miltiorrhiza]
MMGKTIEKGVEPVDSILTTFERIMEKLNRIEELLAIRSRKMKPSPIPCSQDNVKSATPHPHPVSVRTPPHPPSVSVMTPPHPPSVSVMTAPHPRPVFVMTPPPPHPVSIMTPPPPPPVSATSLPPQPPVSLTPPPLPLVSMTTPTSLIETVVVVASAPSNILVVALPTRTSSLSRVAPLSTWVDSLSTKTLAPTRMYASFAHRDWKELSQLTKEFLTTINLGRIYKASPRITVQQGEYEFPNQNSLKTGQIWDVF